VPIWYVPYRRNPFFTGQEDILTRLRTALTVNKTAALTQQMIPQAISGLGGIGKTQIALEYAYRYGQEYQAVLWAQADSREALVLSYSKVASLLHLSEKDATDKSVVVEAVKQWLATHNHWLLILDNADEIEIVDDFLPEVAPGHVLLTTRAQAHGPLAQGLAVQEMEPAEGALLLLRRAKVLAGDAILEQVPGADQKAALELAKELGGLPLALDQAGAYIEETGCGIEGYRQRYQQQQTTLLKRRGKPVTDHPEPVATTWLLSFTKVEEVNRAAADLLRFFSFLSPEAIPIDLLIEGASNLGKLLKRTATNPQRLDEVLSILYSYSLIRRDVTTKALYIHRLVQAVLKDEMSARTQRRWAKRAVRAVNQAFPELEYENWLVCQQFIPHVLACAALIERWEIALPEAAQLFNKAGDYLKVSAQYEQAEPLYQSALTINEQRMLSSVHPDTAQSLFNLAALYQAQGKYDQAEPLLRRALAIYERVLQFQHPNIATSLNALAILYQNQGKYDQAEPLYQRALAIRERVLGPEHPDTAQSLHNLAWLYQAQGKYEQAEPLYQRALAIFEEVLGPNHPNAIVVRQNYADLMQKLQGGK